MSPGWLLTLASVALGNAAGLALHGHTLVSVLSALVSLLLVSQACEEDPC